MSDSLVSIALSLLPRGEPAETVTGFLTAIQQAFECERCVLLLDNSSGSDAAQELLSVPPLHRLDETSSRLWRHCNDSLSKSSQGNILTLPSECRLGVSARHFLLPGCGFLLLIDDRAHWDTHMRDTFQRILDSVPAALRGIREQQLEKETRHRLSLATRAAGIGFFEWNVGSNTMSWDTGMHKLFGVTAQDFCGTCEALTKRLHRDNKQALLEQIGAFLEHGRDESAEFVFNIVTDQQEIKRLTCHAVRSQDSVGNTSLIGVAYDISEIELARTQSLYRSDFENLLLNLSMRLIKPLETDLDLLTQEVLRDVARFVNADRAYIFEYDMQQMTCSNTHEWCNTGITPEIDHLQDVPTSELHWWIAAHEKGQAFVLRGVNDLDAAHPLRQILEPQGIRSLATFPLMHGESCQGFIGFDAVSSERRWSEIEISILNLLSQLLVNLRDKARIEGRVRDTERELRLSRDEAEEKAKEAIVANRSKTDFIARVSHEIRTPLHAINGLANLLMDGVPESDVPAHLQTILASGESMLELINDVLDYARIDAHGLSLQHEPLDLHSLLNHLENQFRPLADRKSLQLELTVDDRLPLQVAGDQLRIRQILQNLLSNAVKFTDQGSVTLSAEPVMDSDRTDGRQVIRFCVTDTGIGIPQDAHGNLFRPFFQLDNTASVNVGTGLGLPIVSMLTDLMGGTVDVQSAPGQGSQFCANLLLEPLQTSEIRPASSAPEKAVAASLSGLRILLAEDNPVNARLTQLYLRDSGSTLDHVVNGEEACKMQQQRRYDAILMDCQMPIMDGFQATRRIREMESDSDHRLPIIGVTANALPTDIEQCLNAGMTRVLNKPFNKSQLIELISTTVQES